VLTDAEPDAIRQRREQLLSECPGRDAQYLTNCVLSVKRSIRTILPLVLPAELSDRLTAGERFAEWKEILCDGQLNSLGWLRWAVIGDWVKSDVGAENIASISLAIQEGQQTPAQPTRFLDEDDSRELPVEFEHDRLRVAQSILLALPFSVYLDELQTSGNDRGSGEARGRARLEHTLQALLSELADGGQAKDPAALTARMHDLKCYGKQMHHAATRTDGAVAPTLPRELGQIIYTVASAVAISGSGQRIGSLEPTVLGGNVAWALKQPWLDSRFVPILLDARMRLVDARGAAG
jgi:hypothetical protein